MLESLVVLLISVGPALIVLGLFLFLTERARRAVNTTGAALRMKSGRASTARGRRAA